MAGELRWGIAGAGRAALAFGQDVARTPGSRVEAVAASDPGRAAALAARLGARPVNAGYQDLFADPAVDVVYVATVSSVHHAQAVAALDAGKHVLVEKPLGMTAAEARDIACRARAVGRFCMEGMWMRMHPLIRRARELADGGTVGDVLGVHADLATAHEYLPGDRLFDPAAGGGVLLDLGVYPAHFAWLLLGQPARVRATLSFAPNGADDGVAMQWEYPGGRFAQLSASFRGPSALGGVVAGSAGSLTLGPRLNRPAELTIRLPGSEPVTESCVLPGNGFGPEIAEVARCIGAGLTESPLAPLNDSVGVLAALDLAREGAALDGAG